MGLSKGKTRAAIAAVKIFTDRDEPRKVFSDALLELKNDSRSFGVLMYYGVGGIGKTSLLRHLRKSVKGDNITSVFVNLEASNYSSFADILLDIRRQMPGAYPLFEYAFVRFLSLQGRSLSDVKKSYLQQDSIIFDLQDMASELAEVVAPARLIKRLVDLGYEKYQQMTPEFKEIDALQNDELEEKLPLYLGLEIEKYQSKTSKKLIVFIDTHEAALWKHSFKTTKRTGDEWLSELIGSSEKGLYVIAGRERLRWADRNSEWGEYIEQHILGSLADKDADEFLRGIPVDEPEIRAAIIDTASGVPLYLDLCASTYLQRKITGKALREEDFHLHEDEVIDRFLAHLDRDQDQALRVMSIPEIFDISLFKEILSELNIGYPASLFSDFCECSYTAPLQDMSGIFKIHDIVRDYIFNKTSTDIAKVVSIAMLHSAEVSFSKEAFERASWVFGQVWSSVENLQLKLTRMEFSQLLSLAIGLIDAGQWVAIQRSVESPPKQPQHSDSQMQLENLRVYILAFCARKTGKLREARKLYDQALSHHDVYGEHVYLLQFHSAHVSHLLGEFNQAIEQYMKIVAFKGNTSPEIYAHELAERQLIDIQMIKGSFRAAKTKFLDIENKRSDPLWRAEVFRFRGHIERFNMCFKSAEGLYLKAKKLAEDSKADAMLGKALTNLAETLCWVAPHTALDIAAEAIELNECVQAPIEIGKAVSAQSIAFTFTGSYDEAIASAKHSYEIQKKNSYQSGLLFALQAEGIARHFMGDLDRVVNIVDEMDQITNKSEVYGFLKIPLLLVIDIDRAKREFSCYEWLDTNEIINSHQHYMKLL